MKLSAVLFDLDGTLLDTLGDLALSMNNVLTAEGFPAHPVDAYRFFVGSGIKMLVIRTLPEDHRDEETVTRCSEAMVREYGEHWADTTGPFEGILEMLNGLERLNIPKSILSNKRDDLTKECANRFLSDFPFICVRGTVDSIPPKPDPAGALAIADLMNIPAGEFLYVGDSDIDMQTAQAAGMFSLGVSWGFRSEQELRNNGACKIIHEPGEIIQILVHN